MKTLIASLSFIALMGQAHALDSRSGNFARTSSTDKSVKTCQSERLDVTRIKKTTYIRSSRMTIKKFDMLPIPHGVYHDLVKSLRKDHLSKSSVTFESDIFRKALDKNCSIYYRDISKTDSYDYPKKSHYVVYNSCEDGHKESLPETTQRWLEFVDANCEI